jgi:small nuclear ribonucleoprotein G
MGARVFVQMNGARQLSGVLWGFDPFLNIVLDDTVEESDESKPNLGMVV